MISHKKVSHAKKTLGAMTSPDGNSTASISMMQEKVQGWISAVRSGHMHCRNVWFSLKVQFWPRVGYGLCSSTATQHELDNALHRSDSSTWQGCTNHHSGEQNHRCGILQSGPPSPRNRGAGRVNKQITDALRLQHSHGKINADLVLLILCRAWSILSAPARVIRTLRTPCHTLLDENVVGKA